MIAIVTDLVLAASALLIGAAALIGVGRIVAGPSSLDRIIAADLMVAISIGGVALWIVESRQYSLLIVLVVLSMLGFTAAASLSRLMGDRLMLFKHGDKEEPK